MILKQQKFDFKEFVIEWNKKFPYDRWWREKHKVAFGSPEHLKSSLIYQKIEFQEDFYFNNLSKEENKQIEKYESGDWLKKQELTQEQIDKAFDDIII